MTCYRPISTCLIEDSSLFVCNCIEGCTSTDPKELCVFCIASSLVVDISALLRTRIDCSTDSNLLVLLWLTHPPGISCLTTGSMNYSSIFLFLSLSLRSLQGACRQCSVVVLTDLSSGPYPP